MLDRGAIFTTSMVLLFAAAQIGGDFPRQSAYNDGIAYLANDGIASRSEASSQLSIDRSSDGLFHVKVRINGQPVDMAIDTGATRSVVTQSDAKRIGLVGRAGRYSNMQTLNGRIRLQRVTLKDIEIGNRKINNLDIVVGPEQLNQSVVGLDALRHSGPILIDSDRLTLLGDEELHP
jgi:aspartyl protease family protein